MKNRKIAKQEMGSMKNGKSKMESWKRKNKK